MLVIASRRSRVCYQNETLSPNASGFQATDPAKILTVDRVITSQIGFEESMDIELIVRGK